LNPEEKFSHTPYNFPRLIEVCEILARQSVTQTGGRIEKAQDGKEVMVIPIELPQPGVFEQCWEPGPVAESRFTPEEMKKIEITPETEKRR
jgi:hypothetical protein